ncbi:MAG: glycosyltransferase [Rhodospirillales bacterium]|nr:glycosyltransferase [Rhodospirillales bacterium]
MKISVIICTRNRAHAITPCLDSVAAALGKAQPVTAEIVVVDNGSTDDTSARVKEWAKDQTFPVNLVTEPRPGLSCARNCALRTAQGDILVWTDDDCRMDPDYIIDALRHDAADSGLVLRGGRVELGNPGDLPLSIKTAKDIQRWRKNDPDSQHEHFGNAIVGCNMVMRKEVARTLGDFDERLGAGTKIPGGEDLDYIYRAYLADILIEYVPDMVVHHFHGRTQYEEGKKLLQGYFIGDGALYAKYMFSAPQLCRNFFIDTKKTIKDILTGQDRHFKVLKFSYKQRTVCNIKGFFLFIRVNLSSLLPAPSSKQTNKPGAAA